MITPYKWKQNHEVRGLTTQCRIIKLQKYIKKLKKSWSQITLIFKTHDLNHEIGLPNKRQSSKNHEAKSSIIQN